MNQDFYRAAIAALEAAELPFLVGGAHAMRRFVGIERDTKDFDIFVRPTDVRRALRVLSRAGYRTEIKFSHWIAKAFCGEDFIDVIYSSGNGIAEVDDLWFEHAVDDIAAGVAVKLCPVEEMIWSKAFVMERERYDGADIAHLLRAHGQHLDWERLLSRFDRNWRVLLSHLTLFGFIYPSERGRIPNWVMNDLLERLSRETASGEHGDTVCQGTLLSREQYITDVEDWGYEDARLAPRGKMNKSQIQCWTAPVRESGGVRAGQARRSSG